MTVSGVQHHHTPSEARLAQLGPSLGPEWTPLEATSLKPEAAL